MNESPQGIYMHIHKCAGTSLTRALNNEPAIISCAARPGRCGLRKGRELIADDVWETSIKFTFVRNPFARVVSAYRMFQKEAIFRRVFPKFSEFLEFLRWADVDHHLVDREVDVSQFWRTIPNVIHHCSAFTNPKYHLAEMDFVGRLESFESDLDRLSEMLGVAFPPIPKLNHGNRYDFREYYTEREIELVGQIYAADLERFDYSFF